MKITISNLIYVETKNKKVLNDLQDILTKPNPEYHKLKALDKPVYNVSKDIEMWEDTPNGLAIPRGTGKLARHIGRRHFDRVSSVTDNRTDGHEIDIDLHYKEGEFEGLFPYQQGLVDKFMSTRQGVGVMPCGAGKTLSALALIAERKISTLVIVHTSELLEQWKDEILGNKEKKIEKKLLGDFSFGQFGCGKKKLGDLTIATVQTLNNMKQLDFVKFNKQFGQVILDEAHHCPARTFLETIQSFTCRYMYGLSATPKRKDRKEFALYSNIGPVIYEVKDKELETAGRSVPVNVQYVNTGCEFDFKGMNEDWTALTRAIAKHNGRNNTIIKNIDSDVESGRFPMVICHRKHHAIYLKQKLDAIGLRCGILISDISKDKRQEYKRLALRHDLDVMVCMDKIAGEGLDIPAIDTIHLVFTINNESLLKQFSGRGRRKFDDKEFCLVYVYRDFLYRTRLSHKFEHKMGVKIYENQRRWFRKWGFNVDA